MILLGFCDSQFRQIAQWQYGSIESAYGQTRYTLRKPTLDGISSVIFASSLGIEYFFSASV